LTGTQERVRPETVRPHARNNGKGSETVPARYGSVHLPTDRDSPDEKQRRDPQTPATSTMAQSCL
jgi:hypothetical protein